ncbi:MAG TPA: alpha/beta hydrolase, partial [Sphingomonadaceae bacterium]|nr:alpha/beta hydrolase [Sphingomonadaceae bacterium]
MATYVLVHGAWGGGWSYQAIARGLRAAGHEVYAPTLTGLGEREHLASPAIDLATHIRDVVNLIEYEGLSDIILCGHSYAGMVITGTAAAVGGRIRTLFYLDAFLPQDGQALWDIADERSRRHYIDAQRDRPGLVAHFSVAAGAPSDTPRPLSRQPLLTLIEPVRLTGEERKVANHTYVYATRDAPTAFTRFYETVRDDPAWRVVTVPTGHRVMADDPAGLIRLLL